MPPRRAQWVETELRGWAFRLAAWGALILGTSVAFGQFGYQRIQWRTEDGLPHNDVRALLQTRDGYLWIGTKEGVVRFDGLRFAIFGRSNTPEFMNHAVTVLAEDTAGRLWVGTENGLVVRQPGGWRRVPEAEGKVIRMLKPSSRGGIWVGEHDRLSWHEPGNIKHWTEADGLASDKINALCEEGPAVVWVATEAGLQTLDVASGQLGPPFKPATSADGAAFGVELGVSGELLAVFSERNIHHARIHSRRGAWLRYDEPQISNQGRRIFCVPDFQGGVLFFADEGVWNLHDGELRLRVPRALYDNHPITCLWRDPSGNIWLGTESAGLFQFRPRAVQTLTTREGLADDAAWTVFQTRDGSVWAGTDGGATRLLAGRPRTFTESNGLARAHVRALAEDAMGRLWIGTLGGLSCFDGRQLVNHRFPGEWYQSKVRSLIASRSGELWVGTVQGLHHLRAAGGEAAGFITELAGEEVRALWEDKAGALWIGTANSGLYVRRAGRTERTGGTNAWSSGAVWGFYEDGEGVMWFCCNDGLGRQEGGGARLFTTRDGLFDNGINQIVEDDQGCLWLSGERGIQRVSKRELNEIAAGRRTRTRAVVYGLEDGLPSLETNGQLSQPAGCKTQDGRLWFPTTQGIVVFDPQHLPDDINPPPVVIERLRANNQTYADTAGTAWGASLSTNSDLRAELRFSPGSAHLIEIQYTACAFTAADRVTFEYQLHGLDGGWIQAGGSRAASYANLRPGMYEFRVRAINKYAVPSTAPATVRFELLPHYYQTAWFYTLAACSVLGGAIGLHRWRLGYQRQIHQLQRERAVAEDRARIAQDLHDGLGAQLTRLTLLSHLSDQPRGAADPEARLRTIARVARETTLQLKDIIWSNHPDDDSLEGLALRLCQSAQELLGATGVRCRLDVPDPLPQLKLPPAVRHNLYFAVKEALNNVVRHAHAREAHLSLAAQHSELTICIRDDGSGFDPGREEGSGRGLPGIRQRIKALGGRLEVDSAPGRGTRIAFSLRVQSPENNGAYSQS